MRSENALHNPSSGVTRQRPAWPSILLIAVTIGWTLVMLASMRWRFLDRYAEGTIHELRGLDFFCFPRGFLNLRAGNNIYLTGLSLYGPYASWYLAHPMLALVIGSWASMLPPWAGYSIFVVISLGALFFCGRMLAAQFSDPTSKAFAYFAMLCSPLTYVMVWNAQAHVLVVMAFALVLSTLMRLSRNPTEQPRHLFGLQAGLLLSLLSKPAVILLIPALLAAPETRRKILLPMAIYVILSLAFLLIPSLNSGGYNGIHWINMISAASSPKILNTLVSPVELDLSNMIDSLPGMFSRVFGFPMPWLVAKVPLLIVLGLSAFVFVLREAADRLRLMIVIALLCILCHYLCYYMVWEYHYATIQPLVVAILWLWQREDRPRLRKLLMAAFVLSATIYLPTPYIFVKHELDLFVTLSASQRLVPAFAVFVLLTIYGIATARLAWERQGKKFDIPPAERNSLLRHSAIIGTMLLVLAIAIDATSPARLWSSPEQWTDADRVAHKEDIVARPGLSASDAVILHRQLARYYMLIHSDKATDHYVAAARLTPEDIDLGLEIGNYLATRHQPVLAAQTYERILARDPNNAEARAGLKAVTGR